MNNAQRGLKGRILLSLVVVFFVLIIIGVFAGAKIFAQENQGASTTQVQTLSPEKSDSGALRFAFIGAAIAFGFGAIGAGIGIGNVGAAAMGAIAEKPEMAGQALIFVALAEGLVIFGFITALMILGKV